MEEKETEEEVLDIERNYRLLIDNINDGVYILDKKGYFKYINRVIKDRSGFSLEEFKKMHFLDIVHPKDHKRVKNNFQKVMRGEVVGPYELEYKRQDGSTLIVEVNTKPIYRDGEVIGLLGISRDITERKTFEENLRKSEEKLRIIYDSVVDGIVITDLKGNITDANESSAKLLGYRRKEELIGKNPLDFFISKKHLKKARIIVEEMDKKDSISRVEIDLIRKDKSIINAELSAFILRDSSGNKIGYAIIFRDITERKRFEEEMKRKIMKYRIEEGRIHLIKEFNSDISIEAFRDILSVGYRGFVIARTPESELRQKIFHDFKFLWVGTRGEGNAISPELEEILNRIKNIPEKSAILIERLDYLIFKNGFKDTLVFVQKLNDISYFSGHIILLSVDPSILNKRELRLIEKECLDIYSVSDKELTDGLYELLKVIFRQASGGEEISLTELGRKTNMSKPTVRKKIKTLTLSGYVSVIKKGRRKIIKPTDKAVQMFLR